MLPYQRTEKPVYGFGLRDVYGNEVVLRAYEGRIDILFVAVGIQQWGAFDPDKLAVHFHPGPEPGDEDLLDLAAVHTYLNGGTVYAVKPDDVPDAAPLAAIYRY